MRNKFSLFLIIFISTMSVLAAWAPPVCAILLCGSPGATGNGFPNGVINDYWPGSGSPRSGSSSINLGTRRIGSANNNIVAGDLVLIIQMQDADINNTNSANYGANTGTGSGAINVQSAGLYEYVLATNTVTGGVGNLTFTPALTNSYRTRNYSDGSNGQSRWQAIRIPQYSNATTTGTVTSPAWDGSTGGVVAMDVENTLNLSVSPSINVAGLGFRGGAGRQLGGATGTLDSDFRTLASTAANASKGEGIVGLPRYINNTTTYNAAPAVLDTNTTNGEGYPYGSYARGAPGNAGGGGTDGNPTANDQNSGGGGGSNYGFGGQGGNAWSSGDTSGGRGGSSFNTVLAFNRIFLGGGGGAGTTNDGTADNATYSAPAGVPCNAANGACSSGAAGGGIVLVRAGNITGSGLIDARGADGYNVLNDGSGGGGGGGSVVLQTYYNGTATVNVSGGNGGNSWRSHTSTIDRHGPGGGGGGGFIAYSPSSGFTISATYNAGLAGLSSPADPFGSTSGNGGITTFDLPNVPGIQPGTFCPPAIKGATLVVDNGIAGKVDPGDTIEYTVVYRNGSSDAIAGFNITDPLPAGMNFVPGSLTVTPTGGTSASASGSYDGTSATSLLSSNIIFPTGGILTAKLKATAHAPLCSNVLNQANSVESVGADVLGLTDNADNNQNEGGLPSGTFIEQLPYGTGGASDKTGFTMNCTPITPDLRLSTKDWVGRTQPGDVLHYTITIINSGGEATVASVTDDIPATVNSFSNIIIPSGAVNSSTYTGTGANNNGKLIVTNISVPANSSVIVSYDVIINDTAPIGTNIENSAIITYKPLPLGSDVNVNLDAGPVTVTSPFTPPVTGTKLLYLYDDGRTLSRIPTNSTNRIDLNRNASRTWNMTPNAAADITIDPSVNSTVPVYLVLRADNNDGDRTIQIDLQCSSGGTILTNTQTINLDSNNRQEFQFNLTTTTPPWTTPITCGTGNRWELTVSNLNSGPNDPMRVYFARDGISRVELPASTVINVDSIALYDAAYPGGSPLAAAAPGQTVYIRTTVSDPFGSFDISSANLKLTNPLGSIQNSAMTEVADDNGAKKIYENAYLIPVSGPTGIWSIEIKADEGTEGTVWDIGKATFPVNITSNLSDSKKDWLDLNGGDQNPGDTLRYTITLNESGGVDARNVSVTDILSTNLDWSGFFSCPSGAACAFATGQVTVSNITVPAGGSVDIVFDVKIAAGTVAGTVIDNRAVVSNPDGPDGAPEARPVTVSGSAIPGTGNKPLYLYDNTSSPAYKLSRTPNAVGTSNYILLQSENATQQSQEWTLSPVLQSDVTIDPVISTSVPVSLYLSNDSTSSTHRTREVLVSLQCSSGGTVLTQSQSLQLNNQVDQIDFSLPLSSALTCNAGRSWVLTVENLTNNNPRDIRVYPTYNGNPSQVILPSRNVINVDSISPYSAHYNDMTSPASYAPGATVHIRAVVSDPFGSYDINVNNDATTLPRITITDSAGISTTVTNATMTQVADSGGATKTFEFDYIIPSIGPAGTWTASVNAPEGTEGNVYDIGIGTFLVTIPMPSLLVVKSSQNYSDPINGTTSPKAIPGAFVTYTIQVINSGPGSVDNNTTVITDPIPANTELFVGDINGAGSGPLLFTDGVTGVGTAPSGLSYIFTSLAGTTDNLAFSGNNGTDLYLKSNTAADSNLCDPTVTDIKIPLNGIFNSSDGTNHPTFNVQFRVRIK